MQMPYSRATITHSRCPIATRRSTVDDPPTASRPHPTGNEKIPMNEPVTFEMNREALAARRNAKWCQYDADVLPAFVAEMDFAVAAPIQAAIERIVREGDYGYPRRDGQRAEWAVACAFAAHMKSRFDWDTSP